MHGSQGWTGWIRRLGTPTAAVLLAGGAICYVLVAALGRVQALSEEGARSEALRDAAASVRMTRAAREVYQHEVIERTADTDLQASHDFASRDGEIPLPPTLARLVTDRVYENRPGYRARFVSDQPFPWRSSAKPRDGFEHEALARLAASPGMPFYRFEASAGCLTLRYAVAERLGTVCVECHNENPASPRHDWQPGDVLGIQEISFPVGGSSGYVSEGHRSAVSLLKGALIVNAILMTLFVLRQRQRARGLERAVANRTAQLARSERTLRSLMRTASDGILTMDATSTIRACNPAAAAMFGYEPEGLVGQWVEVLVPSPHREQHASYVSRHLKTGERRAIGQYVEVSGLRKDDSEFPLGLSLSRVDTHRGPLFMAIVRDLTSTRRVQADLEHARDEALAADRAKSMFLANMSHELRTPMNAVIGMSSLLLDTELDPQQRDFSQTVASSGEGLLRIVNDILDFAKVEAGKLQIEEVEFDLCAVVEDVVRLMSAPAAEKGLELVVDSPVEPRDRVRSDPGRVRQMVLNLLGNALKFTDAGEIVVRTRQHTDAEGRVAVRIEVIDTGIGISPEQQERVFEAFTQADASTTRNYGGTGLGLATSKRLAVLMGGDLTFKSAVGEGSTFIVTLLLASGGAGTAQPRALAESLEGLRALVVDDNETNRRVLRYQLAKWGMRASEAADAPTALEVLERAADTDGLPGVVLLDMQMPQMDGLELAREVQTRPALLGVKLVLLTSLGRPVDQATLDTLGIVACLTKPVRPAELEEVLLSLAVDSGEGEPHPEAEPAVAEATPHGAGARVLVVEDNAVNRKVALSLLKRSGYEADTADNGVEALEAMEHSDYDLVLMDMQMPVMDGAQATREIRRLEARGARHVTVIALTANAFEEDRNRCLAAGMDDFLAKPVSLPVLQEKLAKWMRLAG